ncbi:TetR/AcrR family transcriptional regulator [Streptomyces kanamyceticus]|uniref:TetR/AcrR family transcriptional regulator n=1 Tax=Streptomyces kanamyceticus TaxID=1967 RepID=A0A5J6GDK5_STRKN|nr:TetR/AcrR family transcriptional regulator [Streptomyces kanamyceticus]QEU93273.1 TetR/AcrR family transcriptional regulator [Streptomyces kanamyceticus]
MAKTAAARTQRQARTSVWLQEKTPRGRGRKGDHPSGLDRDRITEATIRLLDAEGLAKFSMRRLAGELDVTAMSVYWYVDTKDDLLELALDAACGEMVLPDTDTDTDTDADAAPPGGWREQLRELADQYRALLIRHPWVSPLVGKYLNVGPKWLEFALAVQRAVQNTGLSADRQNGAIAAVFQFVYGFGTMEGLVTARSRAAGMTQDEYYREAVDAVREGLRSHELMQSADRLLEARGGATVAEMWDRDFTTALDLLMAGIEALLGAESSL